ncbi:MAG: hypothetical protein Q8922_09760 [Bacteroidota bacterium]|nr:hypothetical protein [Bacteroidota bacterium]MDP4232840.1 hypothetical protein [Bacteroidota bacterium]MDP4241884.1 hypothetical protein [Bacteroidota bacterium]MDP4288209.1 hypothetical protein [Bacteroidota bacterium]
MRVAAFALFCLCISTQVLAQAADSTGYQPPVDSTRSYDSIYRARKAMLDTWIRAQRTVARPQEDFISLYLMYGGYLQVLPRDINQFFSERALRPSPMTDRENYGTVDRAISLGAEAQLSKMWGIYVEYDFMAKYANTVIDSNAFALKNAEEEVDLTEHAFVVGGMVVLYSSQFYRLRANGGIGGIVALVSESEADSGVSHTRSSSATGYQVNFDLLNDFRVMDRMSFTLDLLARTTTTGSLKTSDGTTIEKPFGKRATSLSIAPTATNVVYGLAAGLVYYF